MLMCVMIGESSEVFFLLACDQFLQVFENADRELVDPQKQLHFLFLEVP
jgi:hypothetical protein